MGEKDLSQKTLEDYNDVFADIVNGCLFNGDDVIYEYELEQEIPREHLQSRWQTARAKARCCQTLAAQPDTSCFDRLGKPTRSEEHTSELQSR